MDQSPEVCTLATLLTEVLLTGRRAITTVPVPLRAGLTSEVPPSCRSLSRIPLIPTPAAPACSISARFSAEMPKPLSCTSTRTSLSECERQIRATRLPECRWVFVRASCTTRNKPGQLVKWGFCNSSLLFHPFPNHGPRDLHTVTRNCIEGYGQLIAGNCEMATNVFPNIFREESSL